MTTIKPHVHIEHDESARCVHCYAAFSLQSIGTLLQDGTDERLGAARTLDGQVDFIGTLASLGVGNAAEIRYFAQPNPSAPHSGQIDVTLRIRLSGPSVERVTQQTRDAAQSMYAVLLTVSDRLQWKPITRKADYSQFFPSVKEFQAGEILRREAAVSLDRIDTIPPRHPIGFVTKADASEPQSTDTKVSFVFPFVRNFNDLSRFFDLLLLQPQPTIVSIALSPTELTRDEIATLQDQLVQCERYMQLPMASSPKDPKGFFPPLRNQANLILRGIQRQLFGLMGDCFVMSARLASPSAVSAGLMESFGSTITEPIQNTGPDADIDPMTAVFSGGFDWQVPDDEDARALLCNNIETIRFAPWVDREERSAARRLRRLFDSREANCAFRFPIARTGEFPGLPTNLARSASPPRRLPSKGILLGVNNHRGIPQKVRLLAPDRRRHAYIVGQTGTGKSTLLLNMITQDIEAGHGVAVIDPHGALVEEVLKRIPAGRADDVVLIDPERNDHGVGLNLLDARNEIDRDSAVNHLIEIFSSLYDMREAGGPIFEVNLRNSALLAMADPENPGTLADITRVFIDKEYRKRQLSKCTDSFVTDFWTSISPKVSYDAWSNESIAMYVGSKLARFIYNPTIRRIVLKKKSSVDFLKLMDSKGILLADLGKGTLGETNSHFLGMILISMLQRGAFARRREGNKDISDFFLYVDEFQNLATKSFVSILSEARKFRLNAILTNQYLHQIPESVRDAVLGNVATIISFRLGLRDSELLKGEFGPSIMPKDLTNLSNFNAYLTTSIRGEVTKPFNIETLPARKAEGQVAADRVLNRQSQLFQVSDVAAQGSGQVIADTAGSDDDGAA